MSSTHADWEAARNRRDAAAVRVTRTLIADTGRDVTKDIATFLREDAEMKRLEAELDQETP